MQLHFAVMCDFISKTIANKLKKDILMEFIVTVNINISLVQKNPCKKIPYKTISSHECRLNADIPFANLQLKFLSKKT